MMDPITSCQQFSQRTSEKKSYLFWKFSNFGFFLFFFEKMFFFLKSHIIITKKQHSLRKVLGDELWSPFDHTFLLWSLKSTRNRCSSSVKIWGKFGNFWEIFGEIFHEFFLKNFEKFSKNFREIFQKKTLIIFRSKKIFFFGSENKIWVQLRCKNPRSFDSAGF